eukprot:732634-Alexandrium_andersonii.AAC.1
MSASLVGSEMCIRDSPSALAPRWRRRGVKKAPPGGPPSALAPRWRRRGVKKAPRPRRWRR